MTTAPRHFDLTLPHGITLACRGAGAGRARGLLLHGFPEAGFVWDEVMQRLAPQAACVAPNLRGYPGSSAPAGIEAYRSRHLVADIGAVIEALGAPVDLMVAHDWGGALAWALAAQRPELMRRLLIVNAPHPAAFLRELRDNPAQRSASAYMNFLCRPDAEALLAAGGHARLWPFFGAAPACLTPEMREQYLASWKTGLTRINDSQCKLVITSDGLNRGAKQIPTKSVVDEAVELCDSVEKILVIDRLGWPTLMKAGRDVWFHEEVKGVSDICEAEIMDSEDPLFILYTSGSTGKPKGVVHTCGGYMVYAGYTFANVFQYQESDIHWCTADIGWITGHSYIVYGPLLQGATTMMFEGVPTYPDPGRFWQVIDKHSVNIFYTAPTAIRSLMASGVDHVLAYSLHSLKTLESCVITLR